MAKELQKPRSLGKAFLSAGAQQVIIIWVTLAFLDGGIIFLKCAYAFVAYWVGVAILMIRRQTSLAKTDLDFVEYGYFALCFVSIFIAPLVWRLRGVNVW
jgi:hypothetical protein